MSKLRLTLAGIIISALLLTSCSIKSRLHVLQAYKLQPAQTLSVLEQKQVNPDNIKIESTSSGLAINKDMDSFNKLIVTTTKFDKKAKSKYFNLLPQFHPSHFKYAIQKAKSEVKNVLEKHSFTAMKENISKTNRVNAILIIAIMFILAGFFLLLSIHTGFPLVLGNYWFILTFIEVLCYLIGLTLFAIWVSHLK